MSGTAAGASSWPARPPATRPGCPACTPDRRSGGQIKRAALADALPPARRVRVACGPAASLGTATACGVRTTLRRYADAGAAVLAITHDVPVLAAARITGHLALMRGGRVVAAGGLADPAALDGPYPRGFFRPAGH